MFNVQDKYEIRHRALIEAIHICGGVTAYSNQLKVSRSRASNWLNQPEIAIPYEYVMLTEEMTQVSIERLSPFTEQINQALRRWQNKNGQNSAELSVDKILVEEPLHCGCAQKNHPIIVGTDGVLIRCVAKFEKYKNEKIKKIPVTLIDLEALLLEMRSITQIRSNFMISERIAIGLRLEQLLGNRRGQRNDLDPGPIITEISNNNAQLRRICDEVVGRKDVKIAEIIGLESKDTYHRAKQVYCQGVPALIEELDQKRLSIARAAKISQLSINEQQDFLETRKQGVKLS